MMKSHLNHLQINIDFSNINFYTKLMKFLGWELIAKGKEFAGFKSYLKGDLWFVKTTKKQQTNYDNIGTNHIAIGVESMEDVDKAASFLKKQKIKLLFNTPRHRPEFCSRVSDYYQIMFESPDKILFEIVYVGPKNKTAVAQLQLIEVINDIIKKGIETLRFNKIDEKTVLDYVAIFAKTEKDFEIFENN